MLKPLKMEETLILLLNKSALKMKLTTQVLGQERLQDLHTIGKAHVLKVQD